MADTENTRAPAGGSDDQDSVRRIPAHELAEWRRRAVPTGVAADDNKANSLNSSRSSFDSAVPAKVYCCYGMYADVGHSDDCKQKDGDDTRAAGRQQPPKGNLNASEWPALSAPPSGERTSAPAQEGSVRALASSPAAEPPLPEPSVHSPSEEEPLFTADQMRDYCRECRGTPAAGEPHR